MNQSFQGKSGYPSVVSIGTPTEDKMNNTRISNIGYTTTVVPMVTKAFKARALVNFESEGPKRARKVLQKTSV